MSQVPGELKYTRSHEWVKNESDDQVSVGISDHAQEQLGDIVYVSLPAVGDQLNREDACAVVESVKAASDIYAPLSGEVVAVNEALADSPERVNQDVYGEGWMFRLKLSEPEQLEALMSADQYQEFLDSEQD